jgi:hypothetical protein
MIEYPSDAHLSPDYDRFSLLRIFQRRLDDEEARVRAQPTTSDPGVTRAVLPPLASDDDAGYDPLPPSSSVRDE